MGPTLHLFADGAQLPAAYKQNFGFAPKNLAK